MRGSSFWNRVCYATSCYRYRQLCLSLSIYLYVYIYIYTLSISFCEETAFLEMLPHNYSVGRCDHFIIRPCHNPYPCVVWRSTCGHCFYLLPTSSEKKNLIKTLLWKIIYFILEESYIIMWHYSYDLSQFKSLIIFIFL